MKKIILALFILAFNSLFAKANKPPLLINLNTIEEVFKNENVNKFIDDELINGYRETITLEDLQQLGVDATLISELQSSKIYALYIPYVELTNDKREMMHIVSLDDIVKEEDLKDAKTGNKVTNADVQKIFTVMYKTKEHNFDYLKKLLMIKEKKLNK